MDETTAELERIAKRISLRATADAADREQQRVLVRKLYTEGTPWDDILAVAHISRPTAARIVSDLSGQRKMFGRG
jgi:hypothetical protein